MNRILAKNLPRTIDFEDMDIDIWPLSINTDITKLTLSENNHFRNIKGYQYMAYIRYPRCNLTQSILKMRADLTTQETLDIIWKGEVDLELQFIFKKSQKDKTNKSQDVK